MRPGFLIATTVLGLVAGAFVGGTTNAVNGAVSPHYFIAIMRWPDVDVWQTAIAQGIFEGLITGFVFTLIFTTATAIITARPVQSVSQ